MTFSHSWTNTQNWIHPLSLKAIGYLSSSRSKQRHLLSNHCKRKLYRWHICWCLRGRGYPPCKVVILEKWHDLLLSPLRPSAGTCFLVEGAGWPSFAWPRFLCLHVAMLSCQLVFIIIETSARCHKNILSQLRLPLGERQGLKHVISERRWEFIRFRPAINPQICSSNPHHPLGRWHRQWKACQVQQWLWEIHQPCLPPPKTTFRLQYLLQVARRQ